MLRVACGLFVLTLVLMAPLRALAPTGKALAAPATHAFDSTWAQVPLWDDGQAEVALYDARRPQYGKIRSYEAVLIVVKEDFNPAQYVKADPPYEGKPLLPVLKFNFLQSYWTENYPYNLFTSIFVQRANPAALVKLTMSSQEWCGNTLKEVKTWTRPAELVFHSYWDGEGDGTRPLDLRAGDLLEDQLPVSLRSLRFAPGLEVRTRVLPSLISNHLRHSTTFADAIIRVVGEEALTTPRGQIAAWKVSVEAGELKQTYWFAQEPPHWLVRMQSSDGRELRLKQIKRTKYWQVPTYRPDDGRRRRPQ